MKVKSKYSLLEKELDTSEALEDYMEPSYYSGGALENATESIDKVKRVIKVIVSNLPEQFQAAVMEELGYEVTECKRK